MPPSTQSKAVRIYLGPKAPKQQKMVKNDLTERNEKMAYCRLSLLLFKRFFDPSGISFDDLEVVSLKRVVEGFPP